MKKLLVAGLFALLGAWPSLAQTPPTAPASAYQPPAATAPVPLAVSGTTARVALTATPGIWPAVTVINDTSAAVYCNLGSSSVTASTSVYQLYVPAGGRWTTFDGTSTNVACITGGGTGTVHITQSNGTPQFNVSAGGPSLSALSTIVTGQAAIAVTGTAVQLSSNALINGIVVKAKATNSMSCGAVGAASVTNAYTGSGNGYGVCPGEAAAFSVSNSNSIYVNGIAGDIFTFEGN